MTDLDRQTAPSGRTLRRLRAQFRAELLGDAKPSPSDQALIDLAAQAALRVREMRAQIAAGSRVPDEDLVRISNAVNRIMKEFRSRSVAKSAAVEMSWADKQAEAERIMREEDEAAAQTQDDAA